MSTALASVFLLLLFIVLLLNLFSLPANWLVIVLVALWRFLNPNPGDMDLTFFMFLVGLAIVGEIAEWVVQGWGSKKYGSTTGGMFAGLLGAFIGAFVGLPFLFGLGALFGALIGAWLGCYGLERVRGRNQGEASRAAWGALLGRFLGIVIKCAIGALMFALVYNAIWPGLPALDNTPGVVTL